MLSETLQETWLNLNPFCSVDGVHSKLALRYHVDIHDVWVLLNVCMSQQDHACHSQGDHNSTVVSWGICGFMAGTKLCKRCFEMAILAPRRHASFPVPGHTILFLNYSSIKKKNNGLTQRAPHVFRTRSEFEKYVYHSIPYFTVRQEPCKGTKVQELLRSL